MDPAPRYSPRRPATSRFVTARGLRHHLLEWGSPALASPERPTLVMLHGWMDVAASFQFVVDALPTDRHVIALDWRGFGATDSPPADTYFFAEYLGDLELVLDALFGVDREPVDLLGHSMGGNVAMSYAGLRPERIRRLANLEGFGLPETKPEQAPGRLVQWLDELKAPSMLRSYDRVEAVARRLMQNNPLLGADKAAWLAPHWSRQAEDGRWHLLGDPAHKRVNPVLFQKQEVLETWKLISAPVLWVEGDLTDVQKWWGHRYPRSDFESRLAVVRKLHRQVLSPCGHMLHHDQPGALAAALAAFLSVAD